jgi:hypothetical protein
MKRTHHAWRGQLALWLTLAVSAPAADTSNPSTSKPHTRRAGSYSLCNVARHQANQQPLYAKVAGYLKSLSRTRAIGVQAGQSLGEIKCRIARGPSPDSGGGRGREDSFERTAKAQSKAPDLITREP